MTIEDDEAVAPVLMILSQILWLMVFIARELSLLTKSFVVGYPSITKNYTDGDNLEGKWRDGFFSFFFMQSC